MDENIISFKKMDRNTVTFKEMDENTLKKMNKNATTFKTMDENIVPGFAAKHPKMKNTAKSAPLSVINGDINNRKRSIDTLKGTSKPFKQEKSELLLKESIWKMSDSEDRENRRRHDENVDDPKSSSIPSSSSAASSETLTASSLSQTLTASSLSQTLSASSSSRTLSATSSPECIGLSPEVQSKTLFSYAQKKKEKRSSDLIWYTPYAADIYDYFLTIKENFLPNPNYMEKQSDLDMQMRSILVDWMVEVGEEYRLHPETLHHAVSYVDRFLSRVEVIRGKLQLVGTTSMFLAAKYEEIYAPEISQFVFITDNTYTKKQILRMEFLLLKFLDFQLSMPTAYTFLQLYCSMCKASEILMNLSQYICELTLIDGSLLLFPPYRIAAASLAIANFVLGNDMWDENMERLSKHSLDKLYYTIVRVHNSILAMPSKPYKATYEKYKLPRYGCVADIEYPKSLDFRPKSERG